MSKRILITSTELMMIQFLVPHIINLSENGYKVDIACSDVGGRMDEVREKLSDYTENIHIVRLERTPVSPKNLLGYQDMKKIIDQGNYDIIWTNEPVMGVVTRLAARKARKSGTKVIYMVHGFHFYKGAPKIYWMIFYPIEKAMAKLADLIVTVNKEDCERAKTFTKNVKYIHGIGINTDRLTLTDSQNSIRQELGLEENAFLVLSIGELNTNKNQKVIIETINQLNDSEIHYILCGKGDELENLKELVAKYKLEENVHFLGYRTDVVSICSQADVYVMPSHREGLPVASLEAMYCGLPLVTSNIRGLVDVMNDGVSGYLSEPDNVQHFAESIAKLKNAPELRKQMGASNKNTVKPYCIENTKKEILSVLEI